ncbi:hypothetical protein AAC387_Pa01g2037 [Persea americana]
MAETTLEEMVVVPIERIGEEISQQIQIAPSSSHDNDPDAPLKTTDQTCRRLGLIVCRGTAVMLVSPTDGTDEIANPFAQPDGA